MLLNKRFGTHNPVNWIDFKFRMEFTTPQTDTTSKTTRQHDPKRENTNIVARAERRRRGEKALSTWALCASRRCSNDCCCCRLVRNQGILSKIRSSPRSLTASTVSRPLHPTKKFLQRLLFAVKIRIVGLYMDVLMLENAGAQAHLIGLYSIFKLGEICVFTLNLRLLFFEWPCMIQ